MTDYSDLVHRLRTEWDDVEIDCEAADAIEAQAKRIAELEEIVEGTIDLAKENLRLIKRVGELEHELKVECDTYLWKRKLMSRRIASLQYWMKKLFQYASSPEAKRNQMTMTTEIPDYLMREGEDILLDEISALEKGE